jgi:hypothetical protein
MIKGSKEKFKKQAITQKILEKLLGKRLTLLSGFSYYFLLILLAPALIFSVQLIQLGVGLESALLSVSIVILAIGIIIIGFFKEKYRDYSHPIWVIFLGLLVTFVGFTLSGSLQEVVKKAQEKSKVEYRLKILIEESMAQRNGLERTILDFRTLFEEDNDKNKKRNSM